MAPLRPRPRLDPLLVQPGVDRVRPSRIAGMKFVPKCHKLAVVLVAAEGARAVSGGERGRLVEEEQLRELAGLQERGTIPAPELEPACDPAPHRIPPPDLAP